MLLFINLTAWALMIGLALFGIRRGSGPILCIGIYVLVFSILVALSAPGLADALPPMVGAADEVNVGWWQLVLFIPLLALAFPLGLFMNRFWGHSLEPFEEIVGMFIGLAVAFIAVRTLLGSVSMCASESEIHAAVDQLFLVKQTVALDGFHSAQHWFSNLARAAEIGPPPQPQP